MKKIRKLIKNKAGVSAVIGVILMVAITIAISATVYVYVSGMVYPYVTETEIENIVKENLIFTDGYQLYQVSYNKICYDLYDVDLMLVNGDEPIRDVYDLLINLETDDIWFSMPSEFIEWKQ